MPDIRLVQLPLISLDCCANGDVLIMRDHRVFQSSYHRFCQHICAGTKQLVYDMVDTGSVARNRGGGEYDGIAGNQLDIAMGSGSNSLMSDSTNSGVEDFSISEKKVANEILDITRKTKGRLIVATFASVPEAILERAASGSP